MTCVKICVMCEVFLILEMRMAKSARLKTLTVKHSDLDTRIEQEMRNPLPDYLRISNLKKQKLLLKEEINQLSAVS